VLAPAFALVLLPDAFVSTLLAREVAIDVALLLSAPFFACSIALF
jgi:hypothetical protein